MKRDPLEQLKLMEDAIDPRPEFAEALYTRVARALDVLATDIGKGTNMPQPAEAAIRVGMPYDDMASAVRFLTDVLGMRVLKFWGPEDKPLFVYLAYRDSIMSIAVRPPDDNPWSAVGPVSIGLTEPDEAVITHAYQRAVAAGCEILRELGMARNPALPDGYLAFQLRDFEGNLWDMSSRSWTVEG